MEADPHTHPGKSRTQAPLITRNSTAPGLLVASPHLPDPNFQRSVVLMLEHHAQGALGMIVNRPTELLVTEAFEDQDIQWSGNPKEPLWYGGPVMDESCWILHEPLAGGMRPGSMAVMDGMMLTSSIEVLEELSRKPPTRIRIFRGISGWSAGQLEEEIAAGLWLTADVETDFIFDQPYGAMWVNTYNRLGIDPAYLSFNSGVH